jgi:hypothetical protein
VLLKIERYGSRVRYPKTVITELANITRRTFAKI